MLSSGSLLKEGLNILASIRTPLPREGRTKDVLQVLFHKHVWLYSKYMPTLYWWIGASSVSSYVITVAWWMSSDISIHHWSISYDLFTYWSLLRYFAVATVTIATKLLLLLLPLLMTHKYRGSQQFLRVEYSTQIYIFDTRGAKEYL